MEKTLEASVWLQIGRENFLSFLLFNPFFSSFFLILWWSGIQKKTKSNMMNG